MAADVRLAFRTLRRQPGFACLAILIVAIGAAANASVVSVVRGVLLEPLPYARADRLAAIWPDRFVSGADFQFLRTRAHSFSGVAIWSPGWTTALLGAGSPARITATKASDNFFDLLGVRPLAGRVFAPGEDRPGRSRVTVLSHHFWVAHFGGDPSVIGRIVTLEGLPHEIVGILPVDFELEGRAAELWMPFAIDQASSFWKGTIARAVGRLREGQTIEGATQELRALRSDWRRELGYPEDWGGDLVALPLRDVVVGSVRQPLIVLAGAVGLVVVLTAANLGALLIGRRVAQRREFAVRSALGATRAQLVRQASVESAVLALGGAVAGLVAARLVLPALLHLLPADIPRMAHIDIDPQVLLVVVGVSVGSVLTFGVLPVFNANTQLLEPVLRLGPRGASTRSRRALDLLVVAQVAAAIVLGAGAILMGRSLAALGRVDPGFEAGGILTLKLQPSGARVATISRAADYYAAIIDRIAALPGVEGAAAVNHLPLSGYNWSSSIVPEGVTLAAGTSAPTAGWRMVHGPYFDAMRIPIVAGRSFTAADRQGATPVAIVNDALARMFFQTPAGAIGRFVKTGQARGEETVEIVGVVGGVRHQALAQPPEPEIYRPFAQSFTQALAIVVRTTTAPASMASSVRAAAWAIDPAVPIADVLPMRSLLSETLGPPRLVATLLGTFAFGGVLLLVVGVYGVVAYSVNRRERELGIRIALGSTASAVRWLVLRQGAAYAVAGVALGVPGALAASGLLSGLIYGVGPRDPITITSLAGIVVTATLLAAFVPARRASRLDPIEVLKAE